MQQALHAGYTTLGGHATSIGNITPDYPLLLKGGFKGILDKIARKQKQLKMDSPAAVEKMSFYRASAMVAEAGIVYAGRHAAALEAEAVKQDAAGRKRELEKLAVICRKVPAHPAETFHEALQSLWFAHLMISLESSPHGLLLGRMDQYLYPYYERDLRENRMTREQAQELLECFWIKVTELIKIRDKFYSEAFAGFPLFQVAMVGGVDRDGRDATNDLSYLILDVVKEVRTTQPSVSLRCHPRSPERFLIQACRTVKGGLGIPSFVNDGIIIPKMLRRGATVCEARNYVTNCIEPEIPGMTDSRAHSGYVNFAKCLELVLYNGRDPRTGKDIGIRTGALSVFPTFDPFLAAVKRQMKHAIDLIESAYNLCESIHAQLAPEVLLSLLISDCIERGLTRTEGGSRYNHSTIYGVGLATLADSLVAVKKMVFEDQIIGLEALKLVLDQNFEGHERLRQRLVNKCPKFGNDNPGPDEIAQHLADFFCEEIQKRVSLRGGTYLAELHSVTMHVIFGKMCGATPDGREKETALSDGVSPVQGADRNGPTAVLKSVAGLDHLNVLNGTLLNQKISAVSLNSDADMRKLVALIKTYFAMGGHHIQFNVVDRETLEKAQIHPEQYRSLIIRVAGYSAFFNELTPEVQNEIIQRTEHRL
jgi:formate C-acetyltransferase